MTDAASLGVTAGSSVSASLQRAYNKVVSSTASAVNIGYLAADSSALTVLSAISPQIPADYYSFNFTSGTAIKLGLNNLTNTEDLRVQLYDNVGNVVADSGGTDTQKAAYASLTSSDGLTASTGKYYVKVSYASTSSTDVQNYNLQLYSGTTYSSQLTTSALSQAYDPNLFSSVQSTVTQGNSAKAYLHSATLASTASLSTATQVGTLTENQTSLVVSGSADANVPVADYAFTASKNEKVKLDFINKTATATLRVKVLDSKGKVVADSLGSDDLQYAYKQLTSGAGLSLAADKYTVQVGFKAGELTSKAQKYNFNLYSGNTYKQIYETGAAIPTPNSASSSYYKAGNNLNVFYASSATTSSRSDYNVINATAANAINIGWLSQDKTSLHVDSRLTTADNADYYSFTFQKGDSFKMKFNNFSNKAEVRVQILDPTGNTVYADNEGTAAQKKAFASLTSDTGFVTKPGQYVVKVAYGKEADHSKTTNYSFDFYSGTQYTAQYKTTASSQTVANYLASGGTFGYTPGSSTASLLSNSSSYDVISALSGQ